MFAESIFHQLIKIQQEIDWMSDNSCSKVQIMSKNATVYCLLALAVFTESQKFSFDKEETNLSW